MFKFRDIHFVEQPSKTQKWSRYEVMRKLLNWKPLLKASSLKRIKLAFSKTQFQTYPRGIITLQATSHLQTKSIPRWIQLPKEQPQLVYSDKRIWSPTHFLFFLPLVDHARALIFKHQRLPEEANKTFLKQFLQKSSNPWQNLSQSPPSLQSLRNFFPILVEAYSLDQASCPCPD